MRGFHFPAFLCAFFQSHTCSRIDQLGTIIGSILPRHSGHSNRFFSFLAVSNSIERVVSSKTWPHGTAETAFSIGSNDTGQHR